MYPSRWNLIFMSHLWLWSFYTLHGKEHYLLPCSNTSDTFWLFFFFLHWLSPCPHQSSRAKNWITIIEIFDLYVYFFILSIFLYFINFVQPKIQNQLCLVWIILYCSKCTNIKYILSNYRLLNESLPGKREIKGTILRKDSVE